MIFILKRNMAKLIITEKQYKTILEHEINQKVSLNEAEEGITLDLSVVLAIGSILGFKISGHNKIKAENALKDEKTFKGIKEVLSSEDKVDELIKSFEVKGMADPKKRLIDSKNSLISKYNTLAKENGFDLRLGSKELLNLHHLSQ